MNEDRVDREWRDLIQDYNSPPRVPAEEMWTNIQLQRRRRRPRVVSPRRLAQAVAVIAATLVIGIGLGRWTAPPNVVQAPAEPNPMLYEIAAARHLSNTEALLAAFAPGGRSASNLDVTDWAEELLMDTRLLMNSPASQNASLKLLLVDLELVLVQIARYSQDPELHDRTWVEATVTGNSLLQRVRDHQPAGFALKG